MYGKEKAILVEEVSSDEENSTEYGNSVDPNWLAELIPYAGAMK